MRRVEIRLLGIVEGSLRGALPRLLILLVTALVIVGATDAVVQDEQDLHGKVVGIDGERVRIELDGALAPAVGDTVTLKRPVEGLDMLAILDGTWKVSGVERRTVWATAEPGARGVPDLDCSAVIRTGAATPVVETPGMDARPGAAEQATPYRPPTGVVLEPVLIHSVQPVYPELARRARMQCTVVLRITISAAGDVVEPEVLRSCGPNGGFGIDDAALDAVRQWKYRPASNDGRLVASVIAVDITFKLVRRTPGDLF
jgi:protein TonB